jgi:hypothetical protein
VRFALLFLIACGGGDAGGGKDLGNGSLYLGIVPCMHGAQFDYTATCTATARVFVAWSTLDNPATPECPLCGGGGVRPDQTCEAECTLSFICPSTPVYAYAQTDDLSLHYTCDAMVMPH